MSFGFLNNTTKLLVTILAPLRFNLTVMGWFLSLVSAIIFSPLVWQCEKCAENNWGDWGRKTHWHYKEAISAVGHFGKVYLKHFIDCFNSHFNKPTCHLFLYWHSDFWLSCDRQYACVCFMAINKIETGKKRLVQI